jgi:hypothetical protein
VSPLERIDQAVALFECGKISAKCILNLMPNFRALVRRLVSDWYIVALGLCGLIVGILNVFDLLKRYAPVATLVIASSVLIYVVRERAQSLDEIKELISSGRVTVMHDRDQLYDHIVRVLADETYSSSGSRRILHGALHGSERPRVRDMGTRSGSVRAFDAMMSRCIAAQGNHSWTVRAIYTVIDENRLTAIVERLEGQEASDRYEVKVLIVSGVAPILPLIVGDHHVYFALDDPRYYRAGSGMHIEGKDAVSLAVEYFNRLWTDPRAYFIRRATGLDYETVTAVRAQVSALPPPS